MGRDPLRAGAATGPAADPDPIPLVDLQASYRPIRAALLREFEAILGEMNLLLGPRTQALEREFARHCECEHGVAVSSGTDALRAALEAYGIGAGDEVICPSLTFFATIEAIVHTGATPVLVDVSPDTLSIDPEQVRAALSPSTRAIVPVHLYGHPADLDPMLALAHEHGLRVVEDAAQAHGARYKGRRCGSLGDAACFSFYFTKNLGAFGEGGFVATGDSALAERVRLLRHHGHVSKFEHAAIGYNLRMDELQAAVLRLKLPGLEAANVRRRQIAARYDELLAGCPVRPVRPASNCESAYHLYAMRAERRDALRDHLEQSGIGTGIHYPIPSHRQPALAPHPHRCGPLPVTEAVCDELLSLPVYPELRDDQVEWVASRVHTFYGSTAF